MIEVAGERSDLQFILDVTYPEPPVPQSPLYTLQNVLLTPHIAGSAGGECRRMGSYMVQELKRYLAGKPLKWAVQRKIAATTHPESNGHLAADKAGVEVRVNSTLARKPLLLKQ
jgi:phosphoglycerate dehydrogenase-like enzyme